MALTRRTILKYGLASATLLAAGGAGLGLQSTVERTPSQPLKALDPTEYSILAAVADRVCPSIDGQPTAADLDIAAQVDHLLSTLDPGTQAELKGVLRLLENALPGLLLDGRSTTFTAATPEAQDSTLRSWQHSRIYIRRSGYKAIRNLCAASYYADPRTYASAGYPGPPDFSSFAPAPPTDAEDTTDTTREEPG
jgi:hypothetical protein